MKKKNYKWAFEQALDLISEQSFCCVHLDECNKENGEPTHEKCKKFLRKKFLED